MSFFAQLTSLQETPGTPTTDAVCKYMTRCPDDHYYTVVPTPTSDGTCAPLTVCRGMFEVIAPTASGDRACDLRRCSENLHDDTSSAPTLALPVTPSGLTLSLAGLTATVPEYGVGWFPLSDPETDNIKFSFWFSKIAPNSAASTEVTVSLYKFALFTELDKPDNLIATTSTVVDLSYGSFTEAEFEFTAVYLEDNFDGGASGISGMSGVSGISGMLNPRAYSAYLVTIDVTDGAMLAMKQITSIKTVIRLVWSVDVICF